MPRKNRYVREVRNRTQTSLKLANYVIKNPESSPTEIAEAINKDRKPVTSLLNVFYKNDMMTKNKGGRCVFYTATDKLRTYLNIHHDIEEAKNAISAMVVPEPK